MYTNVIRTHFQCMSCIRARQIEQHPLEKKMQFKCSFCTYTCNRKDNSIRHEDEKHRRKLKTCQCGKNFTSSALSRHKQVCSKIANKETPSIDLSPFNISNDQIDSVVEHTMKFKLVTLKDGKVFSLHDDIQVGGYTFTSKQKEPHGNKDKKNIDFDCHVDWNFWLYHFQ